MFNLVKLYFNNLITYHKIYFKRFGNRLSISITLYTQRLSTELTYHLKLLAKGKQGETNSFLLEMEHRKKRQNKETDTNLSLAMRP